MKLSDSVPTSLAHLTIKDLLTLEEAGARLHSSRSLSGRPRLILSNLSDARANKCGTHLPSHLHNLLAHYHDKEVIVLLS